ncbi:transcription-repair coupling factor [Feifania hominis]|uniref:Transcription-repair-coupling factor n=1 Tax=Feifania hominis TaxID=2763660 RepID=A0A926DDR1_9FIRM|nr:transcription-repair coupling factor [Feifania hominis]MBC8537085.1 transcription-repair coupling factor [Feifania hominis]
MISPYKPYLKTPRVEAICDALGEGRVPVAVTGITGVQKLYLGFSLSVRLGRPLLYLAAGDSEAAQAAEQLAALFGEGVCQFPYRDFNFARVDSLSHDWGNERIGALSAIAQGQVRAVVTTPDALGQFTLGRGLLDELGFTLGYDTPHEIEDVVERLVALGYRRAELIEGTGQFARRGGILDVFPPTCQNPVRIEFFGDEIDSMGEFDPVTQRRIANRSEPLVIPPARENLLTEPLRERLIERLGKVISSLRRRQDEASKTALETMLADREQLQNGGLLTFPDRYFPLVYDEPSTLLDYLGEQYLVVVSEERAVRDKLKNAQSLLHEDVKVLLEQGTLTRHNTKFALEPSELWGALSGRDILYLDALPHSNYTIAPKTLLAHTGRSIPPVGTSLELLLGELRERLSQGQTVFLFTPGERRAENLLELLSRNHVSCSTTGDDDLPQRTVRIVVGRLFEGCELAECGAVLLTDGDRAAPVKKRRQTKRMGEKIRTYADLKIGDFVVHVSYGIGQYMGINKLTVEGVTKDYIKIKYAGEDILYVPANQLDLLSKYVSAGDGARVRLNKMGGGDWQKTKSRVRAAVADMAKELISLYSIRRRIEGFAYSPDSPWQREFEDRFPYEETEDQLRCVREIKADMESSAPMDRLLCGDVGFGKTEVALRAAFKAVNDSKQVALLVPTTILAWQHYETILKRFEDYPIRVDVLCRFRTPKQQREIIRKLQNGELDIVVGTHRLIQKDVTFRDLGLVIIDEEQRFGVTHKERLKELTKRVDALTLTATPIPRTLNMALSGIRDMSLIEEPPHDRVPVQTYVIEHELGVIVEAIRRELRRGGQVFYLHNRVDSITRTAAKLQELLPDAAVAVAHGKMSESELSDIWRDVVAGEIDVLVCTTIIETGIDVPNANTLIIEDADKLGLAQLYQIRGRVGRSHRRAVAYLTYRRGRALSEDATKRLSTIREFTEFGSGFKIALRDLEIRGAGNVLGAQQHGHMESVGYDLYVKLLDEAVRMQKGLLDAPVEECAVDIFIDAHIPEEYVSSGEVRIDMYKKIAAIETREDYDDLLDEFCDRFGEIPKPVLNLCDISLLRNLATNLRIADISQKGSVILVDATHIPLPAVAALAAQYRGRLLYSAGEKPYLSLKVDPKQSPVEQLRALLLAVGEQRDAAPQTK